MPSSSRRPIITVLGGINMDLIGVAERLPGPGETVGGTDFYTTPGGKGANQAVAAARMGAEVRMVGRVGGDVFGPMLLRSLEGAGVDVAGVSTDRDSPSGIAIILLDARRQNHIVQVYGANRTGGDALAATAVEALDGADVLMLQMESPVEASLQAARAANEAGVLVVWDPAPPGAFPGEALQMAQVLTPNQTEAEALAGISVTDVKSARSAAKALVCRGVRYAVVKLGEEGVYYATGDGGRHLPAFSVDHVDTVAAGDAFGGALAVALSEGKDIAEAVRYGAAAGALAVTRPGAQDAMPARAEVEALLRRRP